MSTLKPMTPAEAIEAAQRMLGNEETLYSGPEVRRIVAGLLAVITDSLNYRIAAIWKQRIKGKP